MKLAPSITTLVAITSSRSVVSNHVTSSTTYSAAAALIPSPSQTVRSRSRLLSSGCHYSGDMPTKTSTPPVRKWGILEPIPSSGDGSETKPKLSRVFLRDDRTYPNNPLHPVMIIHGGFRGSLGEGESRITKDGTWTSPWVWGIFTFHHYHSTAWELLVCIEGRAQVQLGGPQGPSMDVVKGDFLLIPPGVAHKQLNEEGNFSLLGSYPTEGCSGSVDTLQGKPTDAQRQNIQECIAPTHEPVLGLEISRFYDETNA